LRTGLQNTGKEGTTEDVQDFLRQKEGKKGTLKPGEGLLPGMPAIRGKERKGTDENIVDP